MKTVLLCAALTLAGIGPVAAAPDHGKASWYGESHRGRLMANGKRFDPDQLTAASWFYPLGSKVSVSLSDPGKNPKTVVVTITDRGPATELVRGGRIIDLTHAAFKRLDSPRKGLIPVAVRRVR